MKKINTTTELELLASVNEVEKNLKDRMLMGEQLQAIRIGSEAELKSARNQYYKWDAFNIELLKRLFSSEEIAQEYRGSGFAIGFPNATLKFKIEEFISDVENKVHRLDSITGRLELIPVSIKLVKGTKQSGMSTRDYNKVFIVHGHDNEAKLEVARFIEKMGFEPIILHEQASGSKTIIEKIESYSDVGFGIIIYTPCDIGAQKDATNDLRGRARQNVVFEHGFLIGKLGRASVCSLTKGDVEKPNDISGVVYLSMDSSNWQIDLAKEMRQANYKVDMNKVI